MIVITVIVVIIVNVTVTNIVNGVTDVTSILFQELSYPLQRIGVPRIENWASKNFIKDQFSIVKR